MKDNKGGGGLDNTYSVCLYVCPSRSANSTVCVLPTLHSPMLDLDWTKVPVVFSALSFTNGTESNHCAFDSGSQDLFFIRFQNAT